MHDLIPQLWLLALFILTLGHILSLKACSMVLDHRTAPIFISIWTLIGLALCYPTFGHLLHAALPKLAAAPHLVAMMVLKGFILYYMAVAAQKLTAVSLSSRQYVTPLAVGLISLSNGLLGESLSLIQWLGAMGMCLAALAFFFKGHLSDLSVEGRRNYLLLVAVVVVLASFDQVLISGSNWYTLLLVSNVVLLTLSLLLTRKAEGILKQALFHKSALIAGSIYMLTEIVKFYQQVTINPVTVVVAVQAGTKPLVLILAALMWRERTVREQILWGAVAFVLLMPLIFG